MISLPRIMMVLAKVLDVLLVQQAIILVQLVLQTYRGIAEEGSGGYQIINDGYGLTGGCAGASKYGFQRVGGSSRSGDGRYDPVGFC